MRGGVEVKRAGLNSVVIDFMRGAAALLVLFGHAKLHVFGQVDVRDLASNVYSYLTWATSAFAHDGVVIFFVLSGYLVGGKLVSALTIDRSFVTRYAIDRSSRIYIVSIPAILISALLAWSLTAATGSSFTLLSETCSPTLGQVAGTLIFVSSVCSNAVFWSLIYEVFYYVVFCCIAMALIGTSLRTRVIGAALAIGLLTYTVATGGWEMLSYAALWLIGGAVASRQLQRTAGVLGLAAVIIAVTVYLAPEKQYIRDCILAGLVAVALVGLNRFKTVQVAQWIVIAASAVSAISYSLYLFHAPAMNAVRTLLENVGRFDLANATPSIDSFVLYMCFALIGLAAGILGYWLFERKTPSLRSAMIALAARGQSRLDRAPPASLG